MKMINVSQDELKPEVKKTAVKVDKVSPSTIKSLRGTFAPRIRSRHPSHDVLRKMRNSPSYPIGGWNKRVYIRLGSTTDISMRPTDIVINESEAIQRSSDKEISKRAFLRNGVPTPKAYLINTSGTSNLVEIGVTAADDKPIAMDNVKFPLIAKPKRSSRGRGLVLLENQSDLTEFIRNFNKYKTLLKMETMTLNSYIIEEYLNYAREYRLHVFATGQCIYTNRKMLKSDVKEDQRFYRNDNNSVWYLESNPGFDKPVNFDQIIDASVQAVRSIGLDFGAVDVRVQSSTTTKGSPRKDVLFSILEINSAPSFGDGTAEAYKQHLPDLIASKLQ